MRKTPNEPPGWRLATFATGAIGFFAIAIYSVDIPLAEMPTGMLLIALALGAQAFLVLR